MERTIGLKKEGESIDLGGIGKGFAADLILKIFRRFEISSALTNFGGNIATIGTKPDGSFWRIGVQHPREENRIIGIISIENQSVVTSGDYRRFFIDKKGKRYHHILNPKTGYPAESGLISVTTIADSSTNTDALSTAFLKAVENALKNAQTP